MSFVRSWRVGRTDGWADGRPSDSFSSLCAAFTLTAHINALYNERKNMQLESIQFR